MAYERKSGYNRAMQKALFLDRDGVINEDLGYVYEARNFKFCEGIFEALANFSARGYKLIVITNQSGIGRGYYTARQFEILNEFMLGEFRKRGVTIDEVYFCPHAPEDNCECRKPRPKMILEAARKFSVDLERSIMIGDKQSDMDAAIAAGVGRKFLIDGVNFKSVRQIYETIKDEI
jgi:D,D-heptose 1,7-bisphosphate phosphatase